MGNGKGDRLWGGCPTVGVQLPPTASASTSPAGCHQPVSMSSSPSRTLSRSCAQLESWGSCSCSALSSFVLLQHPREEGSEQKQREETSFLPALNVQAAKGTSCAAGLGRDSRPAGGKRLGWFVLAAQRRSCCFPPGPCQAKPQPGFARGSRAVLRLASPFAGRGGGDGAGLGAGWWGWGERR